MAKLAKTLEEMTYFELLDLDAWCEEKEKQIGDKPHPYGRVREKVKKQLLETAEKQVVEQFWHLKNN